MRRDIELWIWSVLLVRGLLIDVICWGFGLSCLLYINSFILMMVFVCVFVIENKKRSDFDIFFRWYWFKLDDFLINIYIYSLIIMGNK